MNDFDLPAHAIADVLKHIRNARSYLQQAAKAAPDTIQPQLVGTWCEALLLLIDQAHSVVRDLDAANRK